MNDVQAFWETDAEQQLQQYRWSLSRALMPVHVPASVFSSVFPSPRKVQTNVGIPDQNAVGTWHGLRPPEPGRYFRVPKLDRIDSSMAEGLSAARRLLAEYEALQPNWDSYGAGVISRQAIREANQLLQRLAEAFGQPGLPATIVPVPDGGVQFEWDKPDSALEVEVQDDGTLSALLVCTGQLAVRHEHATWPDLRNILARFVA
jgi:hypothetical protein